MQTNDLEYKIVKADDDLSDFVERFWMLTNHSDNAKETVVIPDGRVDLFFSWSETQPLHITLMGLETEPSQTLFHPKMTMFAVNFKLLAVEYLLHNTIAGLVNGVQQLPADFWNITRIDLQDFDSFCVKISAKLKTMLPNAVDSKKKHLFDLIYESNGSTTVKELSDKVFWSARQINRYFSQQFGLSLKTYNQILRFRVSFQQIKDGNLYPEQNFFDQAHFIKVVKRLSGVVPGELFRNKNDRFIQFSTLPKE